MAMTVAMLIIIAVVCRFISKLDGVSANDWVGHLRSFIYIGLLTAWGVSVRRRIIQMQVQRYMTAIAALMIFWLTVRTIKFQFADDPAESRYLWYLYYVGMLFIPLMALFVSMSLGKTESYRLPKWTALLYIPTAGLLLLVLTNDLHQLIFTFSGTPWSDSSYGYGSVYWAVIGWEIGCALCAITVIIRKCRIPYSRKTLWLPIVPMLVSIGYGLFYVWGVGWLRVIVGDITAFQCLLYSAVFECCIQCGLIQSNSNYAELFRISTIGVQITDEAFNLCYSAESAHPVDSRTLQSAAISPVVLDGGIRLSEAPIRGGHVFWQEDVSSLLDTIEQLSGTRAELQSYSSLLQEENRKKARAQKLAEQKRLYAAVREKTVQHAALLEMLQARLQKTNDIAAARRLLVQILVVSAYIKRRSNLIFLADKTGEVPAQELLLCLNESAANLRLLGVKCACSLDFSGSMGSDCAGVLFDFYQAAIENAFNTLQALSVSVVRTDDGCSVCIMADCDGDLTEVIKDFAGARVVRQDGIWFCSLSVSEGGTSE